MFGVTANNKMSDVAGLVIGATLTMCHLIAIPLTGTSVNPARALDPAVFHRVWFTVKDEE